MDQEEIERLDLEPLYRPVERAPRLVVTSVLNSQLRGDEDLLARHAALPDGVADRLLIAVRSSRVDEPISNAQRFRNAALALLEIRHLKTPNPRSGIGTPLFSVTVGVVDIPVLSFDGIVQEL